MALLHGVKRSVGSATAYSEPSAAASLMSASLIDERRQNCAVPSSFCLAVLSQSIRQTRLIVIRLLLLLRHLQRV